MLSAHTSYRSLGPDTTRHSHPPQPLVTLQEHLVVEVEVEVEVEERHFHPAWTGAAARLPAG